MVEEVFKSLRPNYKNLTFTPKIDQFLVIPIVAKSLEIRSIPSKKTLQTRR